MFSATPSVPAKLLIVLIPGAYEVPRDLQGAGFLAAVRDRGLAIDIALVAPQLAHVTDRSVLARLHSELVRPARSSGRMAVWFAGISLGGFLALLYAAEHTTELDGICLLAPYLGNRMITTEICGFQSLADWSTGTSGIQDELTEERRVWRYIASRTPSAPLIHYLGFGREDRFATAQHLLAAQLPPRAVDVVDGGHEPKVWRQLWDRLLDRLADAPAEYLTSP
jgi:pimeloyl-ACP methyl ester carboxylesterase